MKSNHNTPKYEVVIGRAYASPSLLKNSTVLFTRIASLQYSTVPQVLVIVFQDLGNLYLKDFLDMGIFVPGIPYLVVSERVIPYLVERDDA
jgi:hypothetical protein